VARSDLLRRLFAAWASNDAAAFLDGARLIVDDERRKNHPLLARELDEALRDPRRPGGPPTLSLAPLPKGRDDTPLLTLTKPQHEFEDLVLDPDVSATLLDLTRENEDRGVLATHSLRPRQKLLLLGPPGTGKSATAHAIASELSLPVASVSLAALTSSFLGETARNIEAVMRFAETTPCVLLLDEIDALATERSEPGDHGELRRVVATLLQALEHLRGESVVIATTNHPGLLDSAVWRRFEEVVRLADLDRTGVERLLRLRLRSVPTRVDLHRWAARLEGLSPAEVELVCFDALRHLVMSGGSTLHDDQLAGALSRMDSRRAAVANGQDPVLRAPGRRARPRKSVSPTREAGPWT
jgi:SpoVK/Ycf46/Vps4 family AAA+-type ATPase